MKTRIIALLAVLLYTAAPAQKLITVDRCTNKWSYGNGETLDYTIKYSFITGGRASLSVRDTIVDGQTVHHVVGTARTSGMADVFYKVRDVYESYIDHNTQMPLKAVRNISEGRYRSYDEVIYDRDSSVVHTIKRGTVDVPDGILDIVSAFYHARNNAFDDDLEVGDTILYTTYFANHIYPLRITYRGRETVKTKLGKIDCYKFSPVTEVGRAFQTEDDMHVWISTDNNHAPVKIQFDLKVGSFICELSGCSGLKYPLRAS